MLDKHIRGHVERLNPESPVPLIDVEYEENCPGGAANTANNMTELGAEIYVLGVIGNDSAGNQLIKELNDRKINTSYIVTQADIPTIFKVRAYAQHNQLIRFDYEKKDSISRETFDAIHNHIEELAAKVDLIVVSDYAKGLVNRELMDKIRQTGKKVIVDPKPSHMDFYKDVFLLTPNSKEAWVMAETSKLEDIDMVGDKLRERFSANVLVTRGEQGMALFRTDNGCIKLPTNARDVYDVTGAGDTVVATLAVAISSGYDLTEAAKIANKAAGLVVGKLGTSTITFRELQEA